MDTKSLINFLNEKCKENIDEEDLVVIYICGSRQIFLFSQIISI